MALVFSQVRIEVADSFEQANGQMLESLDSSKTGEINSQETGKEDSISHIY